jgi:hypothetical protein
VSGGLSSVTLRVPDSVLAEAHVRNGLGSTQASAEWRRVSGDGGEAVWRNGPDNAAQPAIRIDVNAGLSSVRLVGYGSLPTSPTIGPPDESIAPWQGLRSPMTEGRMTL